MAVTEATDSVEMDGEQDLTGKGNSRPFFTAGFCNELKIMVKMAWPLIVIELCQWGIGPVGLIFSGHLDKYSLDAIALTLVIFNMTVLCTGLGMTTACDTLFPQMFGGENKKNISVCLQKSLLILGLAVIPIWAIHLNIEAILNALGQDPQISRMTAECLLCFIPGSLSYLIYMVLLKYMTAQDILMPNVVIGFVANLWNVLLNYLLVYVADMGTIGTAMAMSSSFTVFLILTILYIILSKIYVTTWEGWSVQCLLHWGTFLKLSIFGLIQISIEIYNCQMGFFLAGSIGVIELGAQAELFQFEAMYFLIPYGISVAASLRIGYFLGAGLPSSARTSVQAASIIGCAMAVCVTIVYTSLRNVLPGLFTNDPDVLDLTASIMPLVAVYCFMDTYGVIGSGVLRGCGKQDIGAAIAAGVYTLTMGVATLLVLRYSNIMFFWASFCVGAAFYSLCLVVYILKIDWQQQANDAEERTSYSTGQDALDDKSESTMSMTSDYGSTSGSLHSTEADDKVPPKTLQTALLWRLLTVFPVIATLPLGIIIRFITAPAGIWNTESNMNTTVYNITAELIFS